VSETCSISSKYGSIRVTDGGCESLSANGMISLGVSVGVAGGRGGAAALPGRGAGIAAGGACRAATGLGVGLAGAGSAGAGSAGAGLAGAGLAGAGSAAGGGAGVGSEVPDGSSSTGAIVPDDEFVSVMMTEDSDASRFGRGGCSTTAARGASGSAARARSSGVGADGPTWAGGADAGTAPGARTLNAAPQDLHSTRPERVPSGRR
jgi:hypothetical protein